METLLTPAVLLVAAFTQGFLGFGFGIIAMGALSMLYDPWIAAGIVNLMGLLLTTWMAVSLRRSILWRVVGRILPFAVCGIAVGLFALERLSAPYLLRVLGLTIVCFALWNLSPWKPGGVPGRRWDAPVGLASGLLTGMFNTGGPPLIAYLYRRPEPPEMLIGTVQALFVFSSLTRLPGAFGLGMITPDVWQAALVSAVFVVSGAWSGRRLGRRFSPARFRHVTWATFGALGVWLAL